MSESKSNHMAVQLVRGALAIAALLVLLGGCIIAVLNMWQAGRGGVEPLATSVMYSLGAIFLGLLLAAALVAASVIIGLLATAVGRLHAPDDVRPALERLEQSLRTLNNLQSRGASVGPAHVGNEADAGDARPLLEQIRDSALMDDAQRQRFAVRHWARRKTALMDAIERDVLVGDWIAAFARQDDLEMLMPDDVQVNELRERVESEQSSRLDEELRAARVRLRPITSGARWQEAEDLVAALQSKYLNKPEPGQLAEEIRRDRESFERENMERLFRDITAATGRHQWRTAILALEEFVRRYPLDPRAEALRMDLPTLQENAATHERKEHEERFKDLLKHQRYEEAIAVAHAAIAKYPQSPTATELNKLLPRVSELALQEAARHAAQAAPAEAAV